jgi:cellulose biosynthesis protein BcsQ
VKSELAALQRRYDFIIIAAPTSYVQRTETSIIPSDELLLTARVARTSVESLRTAAEALRGVDRKIQGLVLWDAPFPQLESKEELVRLAQAGATA